MLSVKNFFNKNKTEFLYKNTLIKILSEHVLKHYDENCLAEFKENLDNNNIFYKENIESNDFNNFASLIFKGLTFRYEPNQKKFCLWFIECDCSIDLMKIKESLKQEFDSVLLENSEDDHNVNTFIFF